jgi:hypothetical protein
MGDNGGANAMEARANYDWRGGLFNAFGLFPK